MSGIGDLAASQIVILIGVPSRYAFPKPIFRTVGLLVEWVWNQEDDWMTIEQLERRVDDIERQLADLRRDVRPLQPLGNVTATFGMFADDPDFDEVVRLGREFREQANAEDA